MSNRITQKHLEALCDRINTLTKSPTRPYVDGKAQVGNFHVSYAYGGVCLHRMFNAGGGVTCPIGSGHVPKRELYNEMQAFIRGLEL
jgi:hypothetical protein